MALYEYVCRTHGAFEILRRLGEAPPDAACPVCDGTAARVISAPSLVLGRRAALFTAIEGAQKSRHEPEVVTSLPPSGAPRRQPRMTPELWKLPRP
jgi:putative FmdB family regulatory protein